MITKNTSIYFSFDSLGSGGAHIICLCWGGCRGNRLLTTFKWPVFLEAFKHTTQPNR